MTDQIAPDSRRAASRLAAGMTWRRWLIDMLLIGGGVISAVFEPMSIALHSIVGLAFAGLVGPHLWNRRQWISGTLRRLRRRRRLAARRRWSLAQSVLLALLVLIVTGSGLWDWLGAPTRIRFHALSSLVLIAVASWHGWTRRSWLTRRRSTTAARLSGDAADDTPARDDVTG